MHACQRCNGLTRVEQVWDSVMALYTPTRICINCGDVVDRVILQNRAAQRTGGVSNCTAVARASCRS